MLFAEVKPFLGKIKRFIYAALPDAIFYQAKYYFAHGNLCDFENPHRFSEKIFHRMRYPKAIFSTLADRVGTRDYIAQKVGAEYLVPIFFSKDIVDEKTFDNLPAAFVMKANHSAAQVKVVLDKSTENILELVILANSWLKSDYSVLSREKHYGKIKPQIIFEHALINEGNSPDDYKVNVFNSFDKSEPYIFIQHMQGRQGVMTQDLYTEAWDRASFHRTGEPKSIKGIEKPKMLAEMMSVSKKVSSDFGYVRVDFYLHNDRVYIGELTLTPAAGEYKFEPVEWDDWLGGKFGWPERPS
jgi:hypothetical protein